MARKTQLYRVAEILAIVAGIVGIILAIISFIGDIFDDGWIFSGGFGLEGVVWVIIAIVFSVLVLMIGLGSLFTKVRGLIVGIVVIIFSIFMPGIALILGIVSGILFIVDDVA